MNVTLNPTVELYVKHLVESGLYPTPDSAVNSMVAKIASANGELAPLRFLTPILEPEPTVVVVDFDRGKGVQVIAHKATRPRLPDGIGFE